MFSYKILQNWTREFFHSSILTFDKKIYLFNCSDSSQRNFLDQKLRFNKVAHVFYNSAHSESVLGTFGFSMSRSEQINLQYSQTADKNQSSNLKRLNYWGPPGIKQIFSETDGFCFDLRKSTLEYSMEDKGFLDFTKKKINFFEDENLSIYPICIKHNSTGSIEINMENKKNSSSSHRGSFAMSYICELKKSKAKLDIEKLKNLGVKPDKNFTKLQNGESIVHNGLEIKPEEVLMKPFPSSCVMILYSPTESHAKILVENEKFKPYFSGNINKEDRVLSLIVHVLGDIDILGSDYYQDFLCKFDSETIHIIDCPKTNSNYMMIEKKNMLKYLLNKVNKNLFVCDHFTENDTCPSLNLDIFISKYEKLMKYSEMSNINRIITSKPGFEYKLTPFLKRGVLSNYVYPEPYYYKNIDFQNFQKDIDKLIPLDIPDIIPKVKSIEFINEPEILFLGTTSMKPLPYRNVSSIMVKLSNNYNMLLDCGEGTFQQIFSYFGHKKTDEILNNMKIIYITHKHGDHQLGLIKVLLEIDRLKKIRKCDLKLNSFDDIVYILAPKTIIKWIKNMIYYDLTYLEHFIIIDISELNPNVGMVYEKFIQKENELEGFVDVNILSYETVEEKIKYFTDVVVKKSSNVERFYYNLREMMGIDLFSVEVSY
jgi:ribonuclease BN (tRNA processing enzyme)